MDQDQINEDAMAAMMGFGSFGGTKKRKLDLVSIDTTPAAQAAQPVQETKSNAPDSKSEHLGVQQASAGTHRRNNNGIHNKNGDTAYFLPSFIEDPWADLVKDRVAKQTIAPS